MKIYVYLIMLFLSVPMSIMAEKKRLKDSNVYWELNSGVLTFSGIGDMPEQVNRPWASSIVEEVRIEEGITSVTKSLCAKNDRLKTIMLPNTLKSIGDAAFWECVNLESVILPNSLNSIGIMAFQGCVKLIVKIPGFVSAIDDYAFWDCNTVIISNTVQSIGNSAFSGCKLIMDDPNSVKSNNSLAFYGVKCLMMKYTIGNTKYTVVKENKKCGLKDTNDKWIIPLGDKYYDIVPLVDALIKVKNSEYGHYGLISINGKEIVPTELDAIEQCGKGFLRFKLNGFWGVMNYQGKILIDTDRGYTSIGDYKSFNKRFAYTMNGYKGECDATGRQISKIKVETPKQSTSVASSSSSSGSSSTSSSSSNSGNNTTIHVEHHHDPVPVQQWQACFACGGMGTMGCDNCGGSGTKYIGDRLHRCSRCNGRGIIPCNVCYGNKGQYVTVYK